ncbi:hypothetical protein SERLA73DRAFT_134704 [Serpula lacrymans var. lacrymans S7.3]|uniref:DUF6534 domain-containing protein n=2 Tax=Serpula lacrymans var. lacrymans TaxID=341189 RepID=F8PSR8_SERL3|nr:uncharacterized protein SERLADRAFT_386404 [Serpula lacrymans var. lacrymans S7.9]EGO01346.1 hypothetical protein SERLA73DRAFT_134704 [Serpula lacrymans var. lacrymans S7.3]EGO26986.1 hypothetical protein SERLADRAFT_386404 [Serpula lacrymans var. lacrymans S7.9]
MALGPAEVTHGPMFVGTVLMLALYGIMVTQAYLYFTTYTKDRKWMKFYVFILFIAVTLKVIFNIIYLYDALIIHYDDPVYLQSATLMFNTDPAMTGIISTYVQCFFAWRVGVITTKRWLGGLIVMLSFIGGLSAIASAVAAGYIPVFTSFQKFQAAVILWLGGSVLSDIFITVLLVWHLNRRKTGFSTTDDIVNRIIRLTIQTGMITTIFAFIDLILFVTDPTGLHLIFNFPLCVLYANSLMSTLNSRGSWRFVQNKEGLSSSGQQTSAIVRPGGANTNVVHLKTRPEVFVQVESHQMVDVADSKGDLFSDDIPKIRDSTNSSAISHV